MPRITFCTIEPKLTNGVLSPFSQGIRRLRVAIEHDRELADWEVRFVESEDKGVDTWVESLLTERADIIGFSCFVWSFTTFVGVAERIRLAQPNVRILLGGPSARAIMFQMPGFAGREFALDALVAGEGEWSVVELLKLRKWTLAGMTAIPGVWVPTALGWRGGLPQPVNRPLDDLPSPILAGLWDANRTASVETFRGCPMSCAFCQWGDMTTPHRVFSEERVRAELSYLKEHGCKSFALIDAGLNLNSKAFRNLARAEADIGLFRDATLFACVYPSILTDEHLEFLAGCKNAIIDVGVQSFNPNALKGMERPFREDRFEAAMASLMQVCKPEPEMIFALPGDNPQSFKDGILRLLRIGCRVRAFHCLVLPDALMGRAKPEHELKWDPETLLVTSCRGWTADDIAETREWLDRLAIQCAGDTTDNTWNFGDLRPGQRTVSPQLREMRLTDSGLTARLRPAFADWTGGAWQVAEIGFTDDGMRLNLRCANTDFQIDLIDAARVQRSYRILEGVAVSYRTKNGAQLPPEDVRTLDRILPQLMAAILPSFQEHASALPVAHEAGAR